MNESEQGAAIRGIWWMIGAAVFFAVINYVARELSATFSLFQVLAFQSVVATAGMLPWLAHAGWGKMRTRRFGIYAFRAAAAALAFATMFYGVKHLPLATVTALLFTTPLFTVLLAATMIAEKVGRRRWGAIAAGFAGALVIIRPDAPAESWPVFAMVVSAAAFGAVNATTRSLTRTEEANAMVLYMYALIAPVAAVPAAFEWRAPGWPDLPWLFAIGIVTLLAQQCITRSFAAAATAVVMPAYYLQLLFAAAIGFAAYGERPDAWIWAGAAIICASTYYLAYSETRQRTAPVNKSASRR